MEILKERTIVKTLLLICLILLSGCDTKRDSVGGSDDLIVLAAKEDRDKVKSLLSTVFNDTLLTPEPESLYKVKFSDPSNYNALKTQTNLIIASIGDFDLNPATKLAKNLLGETQFNQTLEGPPVILSRDQFAKNQLFMIISGSDSSMIKDYLIENGEWIKQQYDENFDKKQSKYLIDAQHQEEKELLLLRKMPFRWLSVYWRDGNYFSKEEAMRLANSFPEEYFKSIQYNENFISVDWVDYRSDAAYKISGLWESIEGAKGGPFEGYLFYDYDSDRTFYINYLVFNPDGRKAFYIRQMNVIARTLKVQ